MLISPKAGLPPQALPKLERFTACLTCLSHMYDVVNVSFPDSQNRLSYLPSGHAASEDKTSAWSLPLSLSGQQQKCGRLLEVAATYVSWQAFTIKRIPG